MTAGAPPRIGFVGLGNIGGAIAANLARDGHSLVVHDLDPARVAPLETLGAAVARDVAGVASAITFASLPTPDDVDAVANAWLAGAPPGGILVDLSTNAPARVRAVAARLAASGRQLVDAPLSGGAPGAQTRQLVFMVGGADDAVARVRPYLETVGRAVFHLGAVGSGSAAKLVNSLVAFSTTLASLEALALATKAGIDLRAMVTVLRTAGAGNFYTNLAVEGIAHRADAPRFALSLAAKDAALIRSLAADEGVPDRFAAAAESVLAAAEACGLGASDWTHLPALFEAEAEIRFSLAPAPDADG